MNEVLLEVQGLSTRFRTGAGTVQAVRGVSFSVHRGETVGVVGESGCGKSVTALSIMRLVPTPPGEIWAGQVRLSGSDILALPEREMRGIRGGRIGMIFQDPFSSLNPTMTLGDQVTESILIHSKVSRRQARERTLELFRAVHLPSPETRYRQYPHQVSGGQRQRVMIAMAFSTEPDLLIADEPTTALDVTVQAQVMALMREFRDRSGAGVLMITHDLGVVAEMCDRVLVMYAGEVVEEASVTDLFNSPTHPYTRALLQSLPQIDAERSRKLPAIAGQPPDLAALPPGCPFADRCPEALEVCRAVAPTPVAVSSGHSASCHRIEGAT